MKNQTIVALIIKQQKERTKKKFKRKVMPKGRSFKALERAYFTEIKVKVLLPAKLAVMREVIPKISLIVWMRNALRPKSDSADRMDTWSSEISSAINLAKVQYQTIVTIPKIKKIADEHARKINKTNSNDFDKGFEKILAVPPIKIEPWLNEEINAFTKTNVSYITKIPQDYFDRIENDMTRMVQAGKMTDDIAEQLQADYGFSESKAALIARDQTNKFNGSLTELRATQVGLTKYEWSTSGDERVRTEHVERDGKIFRFDEPPYDGNPGRPINCIPDFAKVSLHAPTEKAFRRWYDGELTKIISDSSEPLYTTPNHPVLTQRGWIAAHFIKDGDYLIEAPSQFVKSFINNPQCRNVEAGKMFSSLGTLGVFHRIASGTSWFHGDTTTKEVDIVKINRMLFLNKMTSPPQSIRQDGFTRATQLSLTQSHVSSDSIGFFCAPNFIMSGSGKSAPFIGSRMFHSIEHGSATITNRDFILDQNSSNYSARNFELFSDNFLTDAIQIWPDNFVFRKVKAIVSMPWSGWVHNFETVTGWYSSSNLIVHNCRCSALPVFEDEE